MRTFFLLYFRNKFVQLFLSGHFLKKEPTKILENPFFIFLSLLNPNKDLRRPEHYI